MQSVNRWGRVKVIRMFGKLAKINLPVTTKMDYETAQVQAGTGMEIWKPWKNG
jgi:hypothetical protein